MAQERFIQMAEMAMELTVVRSLLHATTIPMQRTTMVHVNTQIRVTIAMATA